MKTEATGFPAEKTLPPCRSQGQTGLDSGYAKFRIYNTVFAVIQLREFRRQRRPWIGGLRAETSNPSDLEWFQWLAEQLERSPKKKISAYREHREWMP